MKHNNKKSTFLIKSTKNSSFGTGFCIYKDEKGSFLLTAGHVVESCDKESLSVASYSATLRYISNEKDTIDLALIYVEGLLDATPLKLSDERAEKGDTFTIVGYRPHKRDYAKEPLNGAIKKAYTLESKEHKREIYELSINEGDSIEQGYSGSAVVSTVTGLVLAIATDRKTNGKQAYATPARYLKEIWKELPEDIFKSFNDTNPYKGLNSFEYKDRHNYYGREKESKEIVEHLKTTKLFTLLGASGSGKSSLIYAGVVPLIEGDEVKILSFRPLSEPFKNLASVFIPTLYPDKLEQIEQREKLTKKLINSDIKLDNLVQRFLEDSQSKHLYLIIDQFEELFTLTKEQEHQNQFLDQLLTLIDSELKVTLLISMRADFLSNISFYEPFNKAYNDHPSQMLSLLGHENLKKIIEEPAKKQGVRFQEGLVERIIEEIEHEAGQLPLLEFALEQFWANKKGRVISHAILDEMQSISHSISHYADKIYKSHPDYQASIEKVLLKLVNPGSGTEDTRRIASLDEFDKKARKTITLLANERLIITEDGNIDIIHEALIREWKRLQEWINHYRDFLVWEKHLRDDRKFYVDNGEKKDDLLRDSKLSNAKEFLKSHQMYISPLDKKFIIKSNKRENWNILFKRLGMLVLVGLIGLIVFIKYELNKEKKAQKLSSLNNKKLVNFVDILIYKKLIKPNKYIVFAEALKGFDNPMILLNVARAYAKSKRYKEAILVFKNIAKEYNSNYSYHIEFGNVYFWSKKFDSAILEYKKAINLNAKKYDAYKYIAYSYRRLKDYDKAIDFYNQAIALNPDDYNTYTQLALTYQMNSLFDEAIKELEKAIELAPKKMNAYIFLFQIYLTKKESFPVKIEQQYIENFKNNKKRFIDYEMIKAFQKILNHENIEIEPLLHKYKGIKLKHKGYHKLWINKLKDNTLRNQCLKVYESVIQNSKKEPR